MSVYDYKVKNVKGESVDLSQYKGKVLIIANAALPPSMKGWKNYIKNIKTKGL